jgi:hypothetical protein
VADIVLGVDRLHAGVSRKIQSSLHAQHSVLERHVEVVAADAGISITKVRPPSVSKTSVAGTKKRPGTVFSWAPVNSFFSATPSFWPPMGEYWVDCSSLMSGHLDRCRFVALGSGEQ